MQQISTNNSSHGYQGLDPDTYTAERLKHASPTHLHLTTRRFFIGPIPEGWLNSHRKSWYKRRLELGNYSSRRATFTASGPEAHQRTLTGLEGPSTAARLSFSFPQPGDVDESEQTRNVGSAEDEDEDEDEDEAKVQSHVIEPVATQEEDAPQGLGIAGSGDKRKPKLLNAPSETGLKPLPAQRRSQSKSPARIASSAKSPAQDSYVTAREGNHPSDSGPRRLQEVDAEPPKPQDGPVRGEEEHRVSPSIDPSPGSDRENSTTALLPGRMDGSDADGIRTKPPGKPLEEQGPVPMTEEEDLGQDLGRTSTGVRFKVSEGVAIRQQRLYKRVDSMQARARRMKLSRDTLQEGSIIKMEKMLVRVDMTMMDLPDEFDENDGAKIETTTLERWREFMIVVRKSHQDEADFRLQVYKSRVIPQIENPKVKKKPKREIFLNPKNTKVNLYASLDKTITIWHPYRKGTRIFVMRPKSPAHAVEWYTFLRSVLGWSRTQALQVNVPDLSVSLRLEKPFADLENVRKGSINVDEATALARTQAEEQAVSGKIVKRCVGMLEGDPEWSNVLETWTKTQKMGLAWKRYDRLEWIHGVNEQKLYGAMAMERSYDLELRPKQHYPTHTHGNKGKFHEEPAPVEGFLIRLTSQKGMHQKMGKAFVKRLYFATQGHYLVFNRPAKVTPPHPPRLATIFGTNVPSSSEIVKQTPTTFDIDPYPLRDGEVTWLSSGNPEHLRSHDREALEEAQRNTENLSNCDGLINMTRVVKVRKMKWGAHEMDEELDVGSSSDVEFHQEVPNTLHEDGETKKLDEDRIFELILDNGLVVRLQAYDSHTRQQWIKRLRRLVKYWKLRLRADVDLLMTVRKSNMEILNIDEEMEAIIGQFARKWEVSHTEASPVLYNICGISLCRTIAMSGLLYRKPRRHSTFQRCGIILTGGQLLIFQASMRKLTGELVRNIHQEKQQALELKDCYVYSGLITEDDLLYRNRTFDSNHPGVSALPRVWRGDGWTSSDEDSMTCFVVWHGLRRSYFKAIVGGSEDGSGRVKKKLRQVSALGVPGRSVVFKCRSRAERDHWVLALGVVCDRLQASEDEEVRVEGG